jgi:peptidoglycan/xylan/chitin deacetylase (PgdA/CDA1 family)
MLISRRELVVLAAASAHASGVDRPRIAITIDDLGWQAVPAEMRLEADQRILGALERHNVKTALFVIGRNGDTPEGRAILQRWSERGHRIGNHTWTHPFYSSIDDPQQFGDELLRCDAFVRGFSTFWPYFRFPALKEGATRERRDWMRAFLQAHGYKNGAVTIDTSDWYYNQRFLKHVDVRAFRAPYLAHIQERASFYDQLARQVLGRGIRHTILLHYNLLNSYFLDDILQAFRGRGWKLVDAEFAFEDPVFARQPDIVPAGESLVWALAKETGRYDSKLRYPGEDDVYEKPILDRLGL